MSAESTTVVVRKNRYLPHLVGLLLLLQLLAPHKGWTILLLSLGGAWVIAHRWAHALAQNLTLRRERRFGWAQVGDRLQERFILTNRGWAPAQWVAILDHSTLPGYQISSIRAVGERALIHWFAQGTCQRRGLFTLGPTSLETGDPFGFYQVTLTYPAATTMLVMPPVVALPAIDIAAATRTGQGRYLGQRTLDASVSAAAVRPYVQGDSLRRIHWPSSARRDELQVRVFDRTSTSDWWLFLDQFRPQQAGDSEEYSIILAASLAAQGLAGGTAVGLAAGCGQEAVWIKPQSGDEQRWRILRQLALLTPGEQSLDQLLAAASGTLKSSSSLILITADMSDRWLPPLTMLMRRGVLPTILLLDQAAFGGSAGADSITSTLLRLGITHYRFTPDLLDRSALQPGQLGTWRRTHRGHWEPSFDRDALAWRELT